MTPSIQSSASSMQVQLPMEEIKMLGATSPSSTSSTTTTKTTILSQSPSHGFSANSWVVPQQKTKSSSPASKKWTNSKIASSPTPFSVMTSSSSSPSSSTSANRQSSSSSSSSSPSSPFKNHPLDALAILASSAHSILTTKTTSTTTATATSQTMNDSDIMPPPPPRSGRLRSTSCPEGMEKWDSYSFFNNFNTRRRHFVLPESILEEELAQVNSKIKANAAASSSSSAAATADDGQMQSITHFFDSSTSLKDARHSINKNGGDGTTGVGRFQQQHNKFLPEMKRGMTDFSFHHQATTTTYHQNVAHDVNQGGLSQQSFQLQPLFGTSPTTVIDSSSPSSSSKNTLTSSSTDSKPRKKYTKKQQQNKIKKKSPKGLSRTRSLSHGGGLEIKENSDNNHIQTENCFDDEESLMDGHGIGGRHRSGSIIEHHLGTDGETEEDEEEEEEIDDSNLEPQELLRRARLKLYEDLSSSDNLGLEKGVLPLPHSLEKYKEVYNKHGRIGIYTPGERAAIIAKFNSKRTRRVWNKKIRYNCRKNLADRRMRVKGRFVKRAVEQNANQKKVSKGQQQPPQQQEQATTTTPTVSLSATATVTSSSTMSVMNVSAKSTTATATTTKHLTNGETSTTDSSSCDSSTSSSRTSSPTPSAPPSGPLTPVQEIDDDGDVDMPDVNDPEAGFQPTAKQPYRRTRRHTIT